MIIACFLLFFNLISNAQWAVDSSPTKYLDINPLRFTNRAECALDSKLPTKSIFLLIDSLNTGKALFRLGEILGRPDSFSVEGVKRYRYTIFSLAQLISNKLLKGELPLLKAGHRDYDEALSFCDGIDNCPGMNDLLKKYWNKQSNATKDQLLNLQTNSHTSCLALKSFSPLEAHLYGTRPDQETLNRIGETVHKYPELVEECTNSLTDEDIKVGLYQLDLINITDDQWTKQGFYFWNSFKIYLSWAYRHAPEMYQLAGEYSNFLRQVNLEEAVIIFSNGCKSIMAPECGKDYLNISSLRSLAMSQSNMELSKLDYFETNPAGVRTDVTNPNQPEVNTDILNLAEYANAANWANNFRENIAKTRGFLKLKLTKAVSFINIVHLSSGSDLLKSVKSFGEKESCLKNSLCKKELFLVCSEYKTAFDEQTSFLRKDLIKLKSEKRLKDLIAFLSDDIIEDVSWAIDEVGGGIQEMCKELDSKNIWDQMERPTNDLFANWYREHVYNTRPQTDTDIKVEYEDVETPYLSIKNHYIKTEEITICHTPIQCARKILAAIIDLKAFHEYASGFITYDDLVKSPNLFNPMSERLQCKSYDPWFKTKKTISDFMQDIFMAGISTVLPTPIYVDVGIIPKKVTSLNELIKEGKVFYDPRFEKKRIEATLVTDFGPLLSAPCALAISNNSQERPTSYLALTGLTLQACRGGERNTMTVYRPDEIENNTTNRTACFSCTINLQNTISSTQSLSPGIRPFVFLARGVVRLIQNLKDPNDIPKSWEVSPNSVYRSWRKHGSIYSSCKRKLLKGEECMSNRCEGKIVSSFEEAFKKYVKDIEIYPGEMAKISIHGEKQKYGLNIKRFACSSTSYKKEDFFALVEEQ